MYIPRKISKTMEFAEALLKSVYAGDVASLHDCLEQSIAYGIPIDFMLEGGVTLLMHAITAAGTEPHPYGQYADTCSMLIQAGVTLDAVDSVYGRTAAHWAAHYNLYEILDTLIMGGCNMSVADLEGLSPFQLGIVSGSTASIQVILQRMTAEIVEQRTLHDLSPLMLAAERGDVQTAMLLIQAGCDIDAVETLTSKTALHIAAENEKVDIVDLLIGQGAAFDLADNRGLMPIHIAASLESASVLSSICKTLGDRVIDMPDSVGLSPLAHACNAGNEANVKLIIKNKGNMQARDQTEGKTCIHWAVESVSENASKVVRLLIRKSKTLLEETDSYGRSPLLVAAEAGNSSVVKVLVNSGCNLSAVDNEGNTALHLACVEGQSEVLSILLQNGCLASVKNKHGASPLHHAALSAGKDNVRSEGVLDCMKLLLKDEALFNCIDDSGMQPIHYALQCQKNTEAVQVLINAGGDPDVQENSGMRGLHIAAKFGNIDGCQYLIEVIGVHGNVEDHHGQTALFYAIESQAIQCAEYLLSIGCSANHRNNDKRSPVHIAASVGSVEGIDLLLLHGGDPSYKSNDGTTAVHDATANAHADVLQYLLVSAGCNPNNLPGDYKVASPLHISVSGGNEDCIQLLLDAGANVNPIFMPEENVVLTPLDYAGDDEHLRELLLSHNAVHGSELSPPSPQVITAPDDKSIAESTGIDDETVKEPTPPLISRPSSKALEKHEDIFEDKQIIQEPSYDHFPPKRANLLSKAAASLKQKSPPSKSILSSVVGLYGAQATMLASAIIGTPLGEKTIAVAEKVATDSADDLEAFVEADKSLPDLEWLQTPQREPTPVRPPTPPKIIEKKPSPPKFKEVVDDPYDRRLRKAKAQMDQKKSIAYQAMDELLKAQNTHVQLKRQFLVAKLNEELTSKRENFKQDEQVAKDESKKLIENYQSRITKAESTAQTVSGEIKQHLQSAHKENAQLVIAMGKMGLISRPTVSEWLQRKDEEKKAHLKQTLTGWSSAKPKRDSAIHMQQAVTSQRVVQHAAWELRKKITARLQNLNMPGQANEKVPGMREAKASIKLKHKPQTFSQHTQLPSSSIKHRVISTSCIRSTPSSFNKHRNWSSSKTKQRSHSLPDSTLWEIGASYMHSNILISPQVQHRAYGPKEVHAPRTLLFLQPEEYKLKRKKLAINNLQDSKEHHSNSVIEILPTTAESHSLSSRISCN